VGALPLAITEAHIDATREEQLRWLSEIWQAAARSRATGVDIRAVTVWALLGSHDWNCLVTQSRNYYESGAFDIRSREPRATAVAALMRELAAGRAPSHPVLSAPGWWRRPERFICPPVSARSGAPLDASSEEWPVAQPILVTGGSGTLGNAVARICKQRGLACRLLSRDDMDIADAASVERAMARYRPWAVVNAAGYVRVDDAERDAERCYRDNTLGPLVIASACARRGIRLLTFSSDLVFDGERRSPYVEADAPSPLNVYGKSKAEAEAAVLGRQPDALVVRTSSFFGPWDDCNFVTVALRALSEGRTFAVAKDWTVCPTYVPDLVHACLDLLIDGESGIWHLTNGKAMTWAELAMHAATLAGIDPSSLEARNSDELSFIARRPRYSALASERAVLLPPLDDALNRYLGDHGDHRAQLGGRC
jgi:dTDP-4-dehydrorhamnose reductase